MTKIKKVPTVKHGATLAPFIRTFVSTGVEIDTNGLLDHLSTFPKPWPFPRGDLYHWIPLLNRFDTILEDSVKKYDLKDGPQTIPWEANDERIVCGVLNFSRMLVEECGNRSLYSSSNLINDLLHTTSLEVLEACLRLGSRLAQRYFASKSRSPTSTSAALLQSHYAMQLDRVIKIAQPFVKTVPATTPTSPKAGGLKPVITVYANDLSALIREPETVEGKEKGKSALKWEDWGKVSLTYYSSPNTQSPAVVLGPTVVAAEPPTSPTFNRRASMPQPQTHSTPTITRRATDNELDGNQANQPGMQTLEIPHSRVKTTSLEELLKSSLPSLPKDVHYDFLQRLRVAWALSHSLETRRTILGIRILALTNLAYVQTEPNFASKVLVPDADEPRRNQLAFQLAGLASGAPDKSSTSEAEIPRWLQAYAFSALEALARHKAKSNDVCAALSISVNHGILLYVVRKLLAEISTDGNPDKDQDEWNIALLSLLHYLPNVPNAGVMLVSAGLVPILVEMFQLRTKQSARVMPKVVGLMDGLIYGVGSAFQGFANAKGLDVVVQLVHDEVTAGIKEATAGEGMSIDYSSPAVDYKISQLRQLTLKHLWKFLHHMMSLNAGGNVDRLLRNLIDNPKSMDAMKLVVTNGKIFGNGIWSVTVNLFSAFIHNEPTSYAVVHEAGLSQALLQAVGGRYVSPGEETTAVGDKMDVDSTHADSALGQKDGKDGKSEKIEKAAENSQRTGPPASKIIASADSMSVIPTAFGAICLNQTGLALFRDSGALEAFFEIFESPEHIKCMVESELASVLGSQFDELVRHHPPLRETVMDVIITTLKNILQLGQDIAREKASGAKVWIEDGTGGIMVSGGRRAVLGITNSPKVLEGQQQITETAASISAKSTTVQENLEEDRSMVDVDTTKDAPNLGNLNEAVHIADVIDDDETTESLDSKTQPGISVYIDLIGKFLEGFLQNKPQAEQFIEKKGLQLLLAVYDLPSLPFNFAVRNGNLSLARVMHVCNENCPKETLQAILKQTQVSLEKLKPLMDHNSPQSFFGPITDPTFKLDSTGSDGKVVTEASTEWPESIKLDGTSLIKSMVAVHALTSLLSELYTQPLFNVRTTAPLFQAVAGTPENYQMLVPMLGALHRACVWEEILIQKCIPDTWNNATKVTTTDDAPGASGQTVRPLPIVANVDTSANTVAPLEQSAVKETKPLETEDKSNSSWFKNVKTIRFLISQMPTAITPFLQGLAKCLFVRRNADSLQKQYAFKVADAISDVMLQHLTSSRLDTSNALSDKYAYWILMLSSISALLIDEHQHNSIITTTLIMFKQNGGLDRVIEILEIFWKEVQELPSIGTDSSQSTKEDQQRMAQTYGGIKVILSLFSNIVSHKGVVDATQNASLITRDKERGGVDYFNPYQFLVELRYAVLPVVRRMWEGRSMEKTSSSIMKSIIGILTLILKAEGEGGAATKAVPTRPIHLSWRSLEPNPEHMARLREMGFTSEQSETALVRFNNDFDRACDMLVSTGSGHAASRTRSRTDSHPRSSDGQTSDEQTDAEMDNAAGVVVEQTAAESAPAGSPDRPEQAAAQGVENPAEPTAASERPEEVRNERLVVMSIDHVIIDNTAEGSTAAVPAPTPEAPEAPVPSENTPKKKTVKKESTDKNTVAEPKEEVPKDGVTIEDLSALREELSQNLIPNCLEALRVHENITFELSQLITNSISKGQNKEHLKDPAKDDVAPTTRREITTTILESLLSLQDDGDLRKNAKIISSTAHLLGLLLQTPEFYASTFDALKENLSTLTGFLKIYTDEPSQWVPSILLILERILSDDALPKQIRFQPEDHPEQPLEPQDPIIDHSIGYSAKEQIFDLVMAMIPNVKDDELLALAIARVTVILTRRRQLAEVMVEKGHLKNLFAMYQRQSGATTSKLQSCIMYILHHIIEDANIIKSIMRTEIRTWFARKTSSQPQSDTHSFIRSLHHCALRDPESFVEVTDELCKHKRYEKLIGQMRYQQMCLKENDEFKPTVPEDTKKSEEVAVEAGSSEKKAEPMGEEKAKEEAAEKPKPVVEAKPPSVDSPDGVVHFLCSELLALKDRNEPPIPEDTTVKDTEAKNADGTPTDGNASSTTPKPERPEYKAVNNPVYVYRCFLLQCLTELLQSYNKSKIEFINFSRKASPKGPITPSKPRSGFLHYLLGDLIPLGTLQTAEDLAFKKKVTVSTWAGSVVVALATQTGEAVNSENESDLVFVRKFLLEGMLKAFKEASNSTSTESLDSRYSRLMSLADLFQKILYAKPNQGAAGSQTGAFTDSQKQIAKIMLDRNFMGALDNALAEIDFNFPSVRRAIKYVLRPLRILSKCALELAESTESVETVVGTGFDEDEISTASSLSDDERDETPDLYRNSALGMFEGDMEEDEEGSFDEDGEEEMYEDEMEYDDEDEDEGSSSGISDEDDDNDAIQQIEMVVQGNGEDGEGSSGDDEDDDMDDDMDDDGDIEIIDEMELEGDEDDEEDMNDDDDMDEDEDLDGEDHGDYDGGDDWTGAGTVGNDGALPLDDPLESIARALGVNTDDGQDDFAEEPEEEDDVDEDEEEEDMDDEDDGGQDDIEDAGGYAAPLPWDYFDDLGGDAPLMTRGGRQTGGWYTLGTSVNRGDIGITVPGLRQIRIGAQGTVRPDDNTTNPLLQRMSGDQNINNANTANRRDPEILTDWVHAMDFGGQHNGGGAVAMMSTLMAIMTRTGQVPVIGPGGNIHITATADPIHVGGHHRHAGFTTHDLRAMFGSRRLDAETHRHSRDDVQHIVNGFTAATVSTRWTEEARLIFGSSAQDKSLRVLDSILALLVPPAIKEEEIRRKEAEERAAKLKKQLEEEAAARKKAEEEEKAKREQEEKERKEREEAERVEREARDAEEAARVQAEAQAQQAERTNTATTTAAEVAAATETTTSQGTGEAGPSTTGETVPRATFRIHGREIDITGMDIDPDFLEALPEELREEVFTNHLRERRAAAATSNDQSSEISPEFLEALPDEIREELLAQEAADRRRRERDAQRARGGAGTGAGASLVAGGPSDMDLASFIATLEDPTLRQAVLMDQDDEMIAQLPENLAAEAASLRRTEQRRLNQFVDMHRMPGRVARPTEEAAKLVTKKLVRKPPAQIIDRAGVATLMRLMFIPQGNSIRDTLHDILLNVCENRQSRVEVINLLLSIVQDGCADTLAIERCFLQLSARAKQNGNVSVKTPSGKRQGPTLPVPNSDITPMIVIQQSLHALYTMVTNNELIRSYFLNEHEVPTLIKRTTNRKGKDKEVAASKASKYALNILLCLLDKPLVIESQAVMDILSSLLANITRPLMFLNKDKKKSEEGKPVGEAPVADAQVEGSASAVPAPSATETPEIPTEAPAAASEAVSIATVPVAVQGQVSTTTEPVAPVTEATETQAGAATEKPKEETKASESKREKTLIPPVVPDANLRLVCNVITAPECSGRTFRDTLTTMYNLSQIPGARNTFGMELIRQAQGLGTIVLNHLGELVEQIKSAENGTELQGLALSKFSPPSSDQAKLLRTLTAIDYLYEWKRIYGSEITDPKLVAEYEAKASKQLAELYEHLSFTPLWDMLSASLTAIHERPEMLHVATVLLPLIECLMVVCKNSGIKEGGNRQREKTPHEASPAPTNVSSTMENLFFQFTEEHRKILNQMVRNNPKLMSGTFALLVNNPKVLEFDNKRNFFNRRLHQRTQAQRETVPNLQLNVRRDQVFLDSFKSMFFKSGDEIKFAKLNIRFHNEEGVDAGGVTREWFQVLARQMFDPNYALFLPVASDRTTFHPNPLSEVNPEHLSFFKFIGRIIGKALYENRVLDCHFSRAVYKCILGKTVSLKDMETLDLDYYKSLCWMLENNIDDIITETFSTTSNKFGSEEIIDLKPDGRNIPVTEENKHEYVKLVVEYRLLSSVREQMDHFLQGFHDIVSAELISIFSEQELELLISGLPDIDLDDWRNNTDYHNYNPSSPQIQWFWRAVRSFDKEERAKLLQFVTGTSKVPLNGFKELEGMNGVSKFNIHRDYGSKDRLPSSHTCFNQIDLPEYDSYEQLRASLYTAITQGADYFGFA